MAVGEQVDGDALGRAVERERQRLAQNVAAGRCSIAGGSRPRPPASRDDQAKAELGGVEIEQVVVAFGPPARCEVSAETAHRSLLGV